MVQRKPFAQQVQEVGRTIGWCLLCKRGKHADCELHVNDGAVDALDFVNVRCDCPCQGEVSRGGKLIDLVARLRESLEDAHGLLNQSDHQISDLQGRETEALIMLRDFFEEYVDDEGNLLGISKNRRWQVGLEEMHEKYIKLVDKITRTRYNPESGEYEETDEEEFGVGAPRFSVEADPMSARKFWVMDHHTGCRIGAEGRHDPNAEPVSQVMARAMRDALNNAPED